MLHSLDVMRKHKIARRHTQHTLGLLIDHVGVAGNFAQETGRINVRVVDWPVASVMQTAENLHDREVKRACRFHTRDLVFAHDL